MKRLQLYQPWWSCHVFFSGKDEEGYDQRRHGEVGKCGLFVDGGVPLAVSVGRFMPIH